MPTTDVKPISATLDATDEVDLTCDACPHGRDGHDTISARYCAATTNNGSNRGCICAGSAKK
jgi:hypothetical protein